MVTYLRPRRISYLLSEINRLQFASRRICVHERVKMNAINASRRTLHKFPFYSSVMILHFEEIGANKQSHSSWNASQWMKTTCRKIQPRKFDDSVVQRFYHKGKNLTCSSERIAKRSGLTCHMGGIFDRKIVSSQNLTGSVCLKSR